MRDKWIQYLSENEKMHPFFFPKRSQISLHNWIEDTKISTEELDRIISYHSRFNRSD